MNIFLIIAIALAAILCVLVVLLVKASSKSKELAKQNQQLQQSNSDLKSENYSLSRYRSCADADEYAARVRRDSEIEAADIVTTAESRASAIKTSAEEIASRIRAEAEDITKEANTKRNEIIQTAKQKAETMIADASAIQADAIRHANALIEEAEAKAREIAGDAFDIAKNVDTYKRIATALKNIINGYGDRYLKPSESVLDGLADEFGFTEAGQELARTRAFCRKMIEDGLAATSDYAEPSRRRTAIAFVVDAFNGKVDSILSTVKNDNIGTMERKINDAYDVVNKLGAAFRNTRITPEYLKERLNELRWASAVIVLKAKQKEEQRQIREQMREEERARREYEKAIKDAEKQEATIRKAIEKATAQLEKANESQRMEYEARLVELQAQLSEAEARNQRALSMAQQTRSGHVYVISNIGSFGEDVFKIGMTRRLEPNDRVRELGDASVPFPFDVHAMIFSEDAPSLENELHKFFAKNQVNKVNPKKEFFRLQVSDVKSYLEQRGVDVTWTLKAEAAQYRQTVALEKSFADNNNLEDEWAAEQNLCIDEAAKDSIFENIDDND